MGRFAGRALFRAACFLHHAGAYDDLRAPGGNSDHARWTLWLRI